MRPIRLEFRGLNSYRERQIIDFAELGRDGLFGIFGPTGSGKSSILDAMTLALYGEVDRAARLRGVVNQQEKDLEVVFEFQLGEGRYRVERTYARDSKDPDSIRGKAARLTRQDCVPVQVLADSIRDLSGAVEKLVGLSSTEFQRAVVLPQGKFDQFLKLKGSDRADMLQRLFNLEQYGDLLSNRAKAVGDACEQKQREIAAEQNGLGDCSADALRQAEEHAVVAKANAVTAAAAHEKARSALLAADELRSLHAELTQAEQRGAELQQQRETIDDDRRRLTAARRAEPWRALMSSQDALVAQEIGLRATLAEQEMLLAGATADCESAAQAAQGAQTRSAQQLMPLTERKAQLKGAIELAAAADELRRKADAAEQTKAATVSRLQDAGAELDSLTAQHTSLATRLTDLATRRQAVTIRPADRQVLSLAADDLTELERAEEALARAAEQLSRRADRYAHRREETLAHQRALAEVSLRTMAIGEDGLLAQAPGGVAGSPTPSWPTEPDGDWSACADAEVDCAESLAAAVAARHRRMLLQEQASLLAAELQDGQPCPVCGSSHHPAPHLVDPATTALADEAEQQVQQRLSELRSRRERLLGAVGHWQTAAEELAAARQDTERALVAAASRFDRFVQSLTALTPVAPALGGSYLALTASADAQAVATELSAAVADPPLGEWRQQVRERQLATEQSDRAAFALDDESQKLRQEADALQTQLSAAQTALSTARERLARVEQEAAGLTDQISATTTKIRAISGDADPSELLTQTQAELDALQSDVERTRLAAEAALAAKLQLVTEVAGLRSRLEQVASQLAEQQINLAAGLASAGFPDAGAAEAALMSEARQNELSESIQAYERECAASDATLARLRGLIAGRTFAEDEYQTLVEQVNALATERARLQDQAAVAQREVDDVRAKRDRWDELVRQSEAAAKRGVLAAQLVSLLRGKRFVQFLAEEHLRDMALEASQRLGNLTGQRYALELADGSEFVIRDDYSGGQRRPAATLSGGETFLTSLALALALSTKIQLAGQYPLGFFFLDEGFGTLDAEKLELVMSSLEKLRDRDRIVGVISHVQEMRDRLPCYLEVVPTRDDGSGSRVVMRRN